MLRQPGKQMFSVFFSNGSVFSDRVEDFAELLAESDPQRFKSGSEPPVDVQIQELMRLERQIVKEISYTVVGIQQQHMVIFPRYIVATIFLQTVGRQITLGRRSVKPSGLLVDLECIALNVTNN